MKKIIFLIPPSEGKKKGWIDLEPSRSFVFEKPKEIGTWVNSKDLKCSGKRFTEAQDLNLLCISENTKEFLPAIERYNGVMYQALDYKSLSTQGQIFFQEHFYICSGMYGLLKAQDSIANYKLPIETKHLAAYWKKTISKALNNENASYIVDLLPESYKKMIDWKTLKTPRIQIVFVSEKKGILKKMSHGVKTVKWKYIKKICENGFTDLKIFPERQNHIIELNWEEFL